MKTVILRFGALLTVSESRNVSDPRKRNFMLAKLDQRGEIKKVIPVRDSRSVSHRQFYPAYYGLNIQMLLEPGDYILMAGERPVKCTFFNVSESGHVNAIPNPKHRVAEGV